GDVPAGFPAGLCGAALTHGDHRYPSSMTPECPSAEDEGTSGAGGRTFRRRTATCSPTGQPPGAVTWTRSDWPPKSTAGRRQLQDPESAPRVRASQVGINLPCTTGKQAGSRADQG